MAKVLQLLNVFILLTIENLYLQIALFHLMRELIFLGLQLIKFLFPGLHLTLKLLHKHEYLIHHIRAKVKLRTQMPA